MKPRDIGLLVMLSAMWGASFLFIRVAVPALGPVLLVEARVVIAGAALLLYAALARKKLGLGGRWRQLALLGLINAALPFVLISTAELRLPASLATILNAVTPLAATVLSAVWLKQPLTPLRVAGLVIGIAGVGVVVGFAPIALDGGALLSIGLMVVAAISYAFGGIYTRQAFADVSPLGLSIGQQLAAGIILAPLAIVSRPIGPITPTVIGCVLALALLSTAVAYVIYFTLIASAGPTNTLSVTLLNPVFGVLWGGLFLREPLTAGQIIGMVITLLGLALVLGLIPYKRRT